MSAIGVVVMAYGTPRSLDDLEAYYTHIRRGRPPTSDLLDELRARYEAIGGVSPLAERTEAQRAAIQRALDEHAQGAFDVVLGMKHAEPFVEDAVRALAERGIERAVTLVLAPHYSRASVGAYVERARAEADERGLALAPIESWHLVRELLDFHAAGITQALADLPEATKVLFTAHSLPERALEGDPYPDQLLASASAIAERAGLAPWSHWALAWQSAGRTPEPWRGPDVLQVIDELARTGRAEGVLVCPQGFASDHLEILYDLDIEARRRAADHGLELARTRSVNDEPAVMGALAELVAARAREAGWT